ncbi:MAG: shikimate dehydrogenase [Megasphaera sp.]|jgi:shikimate dehydrogenase|nr:shikimate dehydrogenase [Megasphaera sp.]MCH4188468.1 shikimate dehydrogenase [Megasphaera sp.]MCH4218230.1 shikimate dehydrogenase [Megasphaera sp.]
MKFGLIGGKLGHSCSPVIHKKIFDALQVTGNEYGLLEMDRHDIPNELERLRRETYTGMNVTIPYKLDVMPFLTAISPEARTIGAVNTIHITDEGYFGYNTDYHGFGRSLDYAGIGVKGKKYVVLGTGGAARAIMQYLADHGAASLTVVSRSPHAKPAFDVFADGFDAELIDYHELAQRAGTDVLVNCTPVGMFPKVDASPVAEELVAQYAAVVDLTYNPKDTLILQYARRQGAATLNGMYMLVAQAVGSEEIWMHQTIESAVIERIAKEMEHYYE